jgi:hypothetical protein
MRTRIFVMTAAVALALSAATPALAGPPESVPPSGSTCGMFYGSVIASVAHAGVLSGTINPGVLHQGFAGAEAFPGFVCP